MSYVEALLENDENTNIMNENQEMINEADQMINEFRDVAKNFVAANSSEFIGEDAQDTYKNIRVFTEAATAQFMREVAGMASNVYKDQIGSRPKLDDYL